MASLKNRIEKLEKALKGRAMGVIILFDRENVGLDKMRENVEEASVIVYLNLNGLDTGAKAPDMVPFIYQDG